MAPISDVARFRDFLIERHGYVLKAWRCVLDPDGDGELLFKEFVVALDRLSWHGDSILLWKCLLEQSGTREHESTIGLRDLSPEDDKCLMAFRAWTIHRFGGAIDMFEAVADENINVLTFDAFTAACSKFGFPGDAAHIFRAVLDVDATGTVCLRDLGYLEWNGFKKKMVLDPCFALGLDAAKADARRTRLRNRQVHQVQVAALREFTSKVRAASGGSLIRGWRQILDQSGNLALSKTELLKALRKIGFNGDVGRLWKSLDIDDDGAVNLQEADQPMALVLATFKHFATEEYGSCVACMTSLRQLAATSNARLVKLNAEQFAAALLRTSFPGVPGVASNKAAEMIHEACDLLNRGVVAEKDISFLDKWEPSPWLCSDPDFQGKDRFLAALESRYGNLISAWRRLIDRDNTNRVSYKAFSDACDVVRFKNAPGIWRALDTDASGFISMDEVDHHSAQTLSDFKAWAESTFGTIRYAFKVLNTDRKNSLTLAKFRRALRGFQYMGDVHTLFQCLKPAASQHDKIAFMDLSFLASWVPVDKREDDGSEAAGEDGTELDDEFDDGHFLGTANTDSFESSSGESRAHARRGANCQIMMSPELSPAPTLHGGGGDCEARGQSNPLPALNRTKSEQFWFCKSRRDFAAMTMVRETTKTTPISKCGGRGQEQRPHRSPYREPRRPQQKHLKTACSLPVLSGTEGARRPASGEGAERQPQELRSSVPQLPQVVASQADCAF